MGNDNRNPALKGYFMSHRLIYFPGLVVVCFLMIGSFYFQIMQGILPCPLCILQRICFGLLAVWFFIGFFIPHNQSYLKWLLNSLIILTTVLGMILASRQLWLQHFSLSKGGECGVSLQYMLQVLPLKEVMSHIFNNSAECANSNAVFLFLDMAAWSFLGFLLLMIWTIVFSFKK